MNPTLLGVPEVAGVQETLLLAEVVFQGVGELLRRIVVFHNLASWLHLATFCCQANQEDRKWLQVVPGRYPLQSQPGYIIEKTKVSIQYEKTDHSLSLPFYIP